jgi:hypothetical protein
MYLKKVVLNINTISKNNFNQYFFLSNIYKIVYIYFCKTTFQDESFTSLLYFQTQPKKICW